MIEKPEHMQGMLLKQRVPKETIHWRTMRPARQAYMKRYLKEYHRKEG